VPELSPEQKLEQRIYKALDRAIEFEGTCFRVVSQRFANRRDVISSEGSKKYGGRFNFKGRLGFFIYHAMCIPVLRKRHVPLRPLNLM
jgi:RES domain-containing protein